LVIAGWELGLIEPVSLQSRTQYPMPPVVEAVANLAKNGTEVYRRNLTETIDIAKGAGIQVWLLTEPHLFSMAFRAPDEETRQLDEAYRQGLTEHNQVMRDVASQAKVGLVDLERLMPLSLTYFSDPIHMTEEGDRVKARIIAEAILDALPARARKVNIGQLCATY
jgi:hypothetical protein